MRSLLKTQEKERFRRQVENNPEKRKNMYISGLKRSLEIFLTNADVDFNLEDPYWQNLVSNLKNTVQVFTEGRSLSDSEKDEFIRWVLDICFVLNATSAFHKFTEDEISSVAATLLDVFVKSLQSADVKCAPLRSFLNKVMQWRKRSDSSEL